MKTDAVRNFILRYQHQLSIGSFFVGFFIDTLALKRIDLLFSNLLLYTYLTVAIFTIFTLHAYAARLEAKGKIAYFLMWVPFVGQFAFGGMFSGFLIFYSQSGSVLASWPFLLLIVVLLAANEFMRSYQSKLTYQSLLIFFCLFSFSIYSVPIAVGRMGDLVFEASGLIALALFALLLSALSFIDFKRVKNSLHNIIIGSVAIYGLITVLYFSNVLPPIPLALKSIGVYYSVERVEGGYRVTETPESLRDRFSRQDVYVGEGEPLYAFSSVFAPTALTTSIQHRWEQYDTESGTWITMSTIPFSINGGRDGGYRGYTTADIDEAGVWRVNVETLRGQLIGRHSFEVHMSTSTQPRSVRILE